MEYYIEKIYMSVTDNTILVEITDLDKAITDNKDNPDYQKWILIDQVVWFETEGEN